MALTVLFLLCFASQFMVYNLPTVVAAVALNSETDKLALLDLKEKLTNGVPNALPSWNESVHFCEWKGVTCSRRHMRVSILHLENQYWGGTLGPTLGNLTFLSKLNLSNIKLHAEIPTQVGRLKQLKVLDLRNNNLRGQIPNQLTNCTNLQVIWISNNKLTGKVPTWLGSMMQLTVLHLGVNDLVGTIPPSLGNLSSLVSIALRRNHLQGSIPHTLGRLSNLKGLYMSFNGLSGIVPDSLYNLSNIQEFLIAGNQLFGTLPSNIQLAFPNLQTFFIYENHFTGMIPSSISNLTRLRFFDITLNGFHGPIPRDLGRLNQLQTFTIGANRFGSGKAHDLDFLFSLTNCTELQDLELFGNRFGGVLPNVIGNLSTNLNWLDMEGNQFSGKLPEGIGQLISLTYLSVFNNFLEGTIPNSIGKLKRLVILALENNKLSGNIPTIIGNLTMLSEVYLSINKFGGSIPVSLRYCTQMRIFSAYNNKLSGDIPNQTFGQLEGLVNLDLSTNSLIGSIPSDFGNLKHLSHLYLYENKLSGEIPLELGACLTLTMLGLQSNFLQGSIPSFLGSLKSLEILDLSSNNLSSRIPCELENLTLLYILNLSFNHLYGEVPKGGVFNNVTAISLIGNKDLCGGIPQLKLPTCLGFPLKKHKKFVEEKLFILIIAVGGVSVSFIVLFLSIYYIRKKSKKLSSSSTQNSYLRVSYGELHEATNAFSSSNLVGTGSFGSVYRGSLPHFDRPIAVKVLKLETRDASKSFITECETLGKIKHRNLLKILTCCSSIDYSGQDFKAIVFEFMPNGSLDSLLHNNGQGESRNINLNLTQRLNIALDVANAMDYLHNDSEPAIVHCDIKPSNVLLDDEIVAHLGDFGLARLLHGSNREQVIASTIKGTIGYVPPEYGAGGPITPEGDIYSYGILVLEMLTGKKPTDSMFGEDVSLHMFCKMAIPKRIADIVDSFLLIPFAEESTVVMRQQNIQECLVSLFRIGVACSEEFPSQRMDIKNVILELLAIKQKLSI